MTSKQPPRIATWMLKHFGSGPNNDVVLGDLAEQYLQKDSAIWYWRQAISGIAVSLIRETRSCQQVAARALLTGWVMWIIGLTWFFPSVSPYFFGNGLAASVSPAHPIQTAWSFMWMPVLGPFSTSQFGGLPYLVFAIALPLIVGAMCGWLVARFHREHQTSVVLLFAGSILLINMLLFGPFILVVGRPVAYAVIGPLAANFAASVLGILLGGGLLHDRARAVR